MSEPSFQLLPPTSARPLPFPTQHNAERDQEPECQSIAAQIAAELAHIKKLGEKYGRKELRITNVGPSKVGKTTLAGSTPPPLRTAHFTLGGVANSVELLQASLEAALQDEEVLVPPHLGAGNHHRTHWVCQDSYTTSLPGQG
jgi:hypothetical protein